MTPNFSLFRKLYQRIAAKPEALVRLNSYRSHSNECGTPFCVLGELCEMPEARALGFSWLGKAVPLFLGDDAHCGLTASIALGISISENRALFNMRKRSDITDKAEALARIEKLFADHAEPLHLPDSIEYARRDEVVA